MESTSSSEDNILETCIIDSSDLESAENEIDGPSQSKNTEELAGTTDSLSRIEGGYESEKTDKNEDVDDRNNEKCASDNEIEYYKSDTKRYNEHERNDSEDNNMIEMHSTPEISYHINDPINTEVAKKSHGVPSDQECLLMGPCPEDPKKMENLVNTTPKEKDEKKEELNSCEMVKEKELNEKKQENAVTANDNDDKDMEDGTEVVEEQKEFFHNEGKADKNDVSGEKEDVDDDKEISNNSYKEENDEPRDTVDDTELVDNVSLKDQGIAEQDNESVSFDFKELIAAINGDVDHDVVRNVNIIDPGVPNYNKKIFIDDIVRDERSKNIIEEVENRLCGKSDKECETEEYVRKEHENVTHGNTEVQQNESKRNMKMSWNMLQRKEMKMRMY
ncbi:hypothetical protein THOM_2519 [Trachipleistophora hominis]|uniref:Uncharacterized protein n=1 Tax=Trachipleistophora hominis TaxID=72359 RepID=L7JTF0_TRAHO|nr:hypothetical protein THOM_2519 [Trachipleistophora hominis]